MRIQAQSVGRTRGWSDPKWAQSDQRPSGDVQIGSTACFRGGPVEVVMGVERMLGQSVGPPSHLLCVLSVHVLVSELKAHM